VAHFCYFRGLHFSGGGYGPWAKVFSILVVWMLYIIWWVFGTRSVPAGTVTGFSAPQSTCYGLGAFGAVVAEWIYSDIQILVCLLALRLSPSQGSVIFSRLR